MALQLLKRNYTMQGYEQPKILKLPQGETRWAPRRLPVDVGDVMMNIRMDDGKNKYIGENISKYSQGINPYGEWGYPYKINKNNIRPPIIDPKFYQPLSRMPVKFDSVSAGPIVKDLYGKRVEISKVAPQTIIDKVCPNAAPRPSARKQVNTGYQQGSINLHLKQPRASIPYHPSLPVHVNTGVPQIELDAKMMVRPQMGIHGPFTHSDQSRDVHNMRTPMHVAVKPGYKDPYTLVQPTVENVLGLNENLNNVAANSSRKAPYTFIQQQSDNVIGVHDNLQHSSASSNLAAPVPTVSNITRQTPDLTPQVRTSAWYNPSYFLTDLSGYSIGNVDKRCVDETPLHTAGQTNISSHLKQGELGEFSLPDSLNPGEFEPKGNVPTIQKHQEYNRARETNPQQYHFVANQGQYGEAIPGTVSSFSQEQNQEQNQEYFSQPTTHQQGPRQAGIRNRMITQTPRVDRTGVEPSERVIPVGTGRFIHNTF